MIETLDGNWQGLMHDTEGVRGRSTLTLQGGAEISGAFCYEPSGNHEPGKEQHSPIRGRLAGDGQVLLETQIQGGDKFRFEGRLFEVRHHARAALCCIYVSEGEEQGTGSAGTAIFWLFDEKF